MKLRASYIALPMLALFFQPALAFDCSKASTTVEKAICTTPDLKHLDDRLAAAYAAAKAELTPAQQKMLVRSQRRWIARRENCGGIDGDIAACVKTQTEDRLTLLSGQPQSGPGAEGKLVPQFIVQDGTASSYDLNVAVLRFAAPQTPGEKALNAIADKDLASFKLGNSGEDTGGAIYAEEDIWTLVYASPSLMSVRSDFYSDSGGAHGNYGTTNINLNMATGRKLTLRDVLTEPSAAIMALECRRQILSEKKKRLQQGGDDEPVTADEAVVAAQVRDLAYWSIGESQIVVSFDPYIIGSYAEGTYSCSFPTAEVKKLAIPGAPIP